MRTLYALVGSIIGAILGTILAAVALVIWILLAMLALNPSSPWTLTRILTVAPIALIMILLGAWLGARYGKKRPATQAEHGRAVMFLVWSVIVFALFVILIVWSKW